MTEVDYGYGEDLDYGYGEPDMVVAVEDSVVQSTMMEETHGRANHTIIIDESTIATADIPNEVRRTPKRRCSVTKFSLESDTPTILTAASVIDAMRNGAHDVIPSVTTSDTNIGTNDDERRIVTPHNSSDFCYYNNDDDQVVVETAFEEIHITADDDWNAEPATAANNKATSPKGKKNGVLRMLSMRRK